jgi:hypothetical protein
MPEAKAAKEKNTAENATANLTIVSPS